MTAQHQQRESELLEAKVQAEHENQEKSQISCKHEP